MRYGMEPDGKYAVWYGMEPSSMYAVLYGMEPGRKYAAWYSMELGSKYAVLYGMERGRRQTNVQFSTSCRSSCCQRFYSHKGYLHNVSYIPLNVALL